MKHSRIMIRRRRLLRAVAGILVTAPLARTLPVLAQERVSESDDLARELGYRHDASQVDTSRFPKRTGAEGAEQFCRTCQFFQGGGGDTWAPCTVFSGRLVNRSGWCNSWFQRVG